MTTAKFYVPMFLCAAAFPCFAQTRPVTRQPLKITKVTVTDPDGAHVTQLEVELQKAPDNMEPVAEPRQIRIDDRAPVRFVLKNLSPLDVCTRNPGAPTPTAETPVAESIVTTIAGLGGLAVGSTTKTLTNSAEPNLTMADVIALNLPVTPVPTPRAASEDPEYRTLMTRAKEFFCRAQSLVGVTQYPDKCNDIARESRPQLSLAKGIDSAGRTLAGYAGSDFRGIAEGDFFVEGDPAASPPRNVPNPLLDPVRQAYSTPISSIEAAGRLQAIVDEITTWATDLHKKYDYKAPSRLAFCSFMQQL